MTAPQGALLDARELLHRFEWLFKVRPVPMAELLLKVMAPADRRFAVESANGVRMLVDPLSDLGRKLVTTLSYEPDVERLVAELLQPGATFVDIGANEGYFSAYASKLVGEKGRVVAVEPQARLQWLLEANLKVNGAENFSIVPAAIGANSGEGTLHLAPVLNHGSSGFIKLSRFWTNSQTVPVITAGELFERATIDKADLVKIDVEGFEDGVVGSLVPLCAAGRVAHVLIDYHAYLLARRGVNQRAIHDALVLSGMEQQREVPQTGYVLYRYRGRE